MAGITLSEFLDEVTSQDLAINNDIRGATAAYDELKQAQTVRAQAVVAGGGDNAIVARASEQGALQAQNNSRAVASALGTNAEAASYKMIDLADQITSSYAMANAQLDSIYAKKQVGLQDGPIKYLGAQLSLKKDIEVFNYAADKHNIAATEMALLNDLTQTSTKTQYDIAATRDASTVAAKSDFEVQKAKEAAAQIDAQTAQFEVEKIRTVQQMTGEQLDLKYKAYSVGVQEEQRALMNEQRQQIRAEAQDRLELAKQNKGDFAESASIISIGSQSLGLGPISEARVRQALKLGGKTADQMRKYLDVGVTRMATGNITIGDNAGDAVRLLTDTNAPLTPAKAQVKDFIQTAYSDVIKSAATSGVDLKSTAAIDGAVQAHVNNTAVQQMRNIKSGDASNIYRAADVQTIAKNSVAVAESPLYQKVLRPIAATVEQMDSDPQRIADLAIKSIEAGTLTHDEAVMGLATYYRAATDLNVATKGYNDMHVPVPPNSAYHVKLTPTWGATNTYNMSDPKDIIRYMTLRQLEVSSARYRLFNPTSGEAE